MGRILNRFSVAAVRSLMFLVWWILNVCVQFAAVVVAAVVLSLILSFRDGTLWMSELAKTILAADQVGANVIFVMLLYWWHRWLGLIGDKEQPRLDFVMMSLLGYIVALVAPIFIVYGVAWLWHFRSGMDFPALFLSILSQWGWFASAMVLGFIPPLVYLVSKKNWAFLLLTSEERETLPLM